MELKKCIVMLLFSILCFYGVSGNPCAGRDSGDWCSGTGYVSCPSTTVRPCQAGLVCSQPSAGTVYCVRPSEAVNVPTPPSQSTQRPTPTTAPTAAPTQRPPTPAPTQPAEDSDEWECDDEEEVPATSSSSSTASSSTTSRTSAAATTAATVTTAAATVSTSGTATTGQSGGKWPNGQPVKAIYIDNFCWDYGFSFKTLVDSGYNLIILAFIVNTVSLDCTIAWGSMSEAAQRDTISYAHSKGARIIVSTGGSTDFPYNVIGGTAYGQSVARWAVANHLDGVDFDLENFARDFTFASMSSSAVIQWVADATNAARAILGSDGIIAHAPQPPYFGNYGWANGYGQVYTKAPSIDFFLVQYYNNGPTNSYESIFLSNSNGASVTQIAALGIPMSKIVVGKPVKTNDIGDPSQGYNTAAELKAMFARAKAELGWNAGVMGWQWWDVSTNTAWINTIYPK